jgi:hypothetical protein
MLDYTIIYIYNIIITSCDVHSTDPRYRRHTQIEADIELQQYVVLHTGFQYRMHAHEEESDIYT